MNIWPSVGAAGRHPKTVRFLIYPLLSVILAGVTGVTIAATIHRPEVEGLADFKPPLPTRLLDRHGEVTRTYAREHRHLLDPGDIPPLLRNAVLAVEDAGFYEHGPIDPPAVGRAVLANLRELRWAEGFSTITMQVARHFFLTRNKTVRRKISEIFLAIELEKRFTKDQILALYMNVVTNLGHGNYGFAAAARAYYDKNVDELALVEAATLAGIPRWPSRYDVYRNPEAVLERRNHVLWRMLQEELIDREAFDQARAQPLGIQPPERDEITAGAHFHEEVRRHLASNYGSSKLYEGGLTVETTLDPQIQEATEAVLREHLGRLRQRSGFEDLEGAVVVLETKTGAIRALVGGFDYATSELNRVTQSQRQVGSTFKPLVFGAALENGFTAADTLFDGPITFPDADGTPSYSPRNDDRRYRGAITLRHALEKSINVPAVKLMDIIGAERVIDFAQRAGIHSELHPYPTLALGSASLRPLEVATAYATIGNGGLRVEPYLIEDIHAPDGTNLFTHQGGAMQAMTPQVAWVLTHLLRGVARRGTASWELAKLPIDVAGKTGTTNSAADVWFAGMVPRYSIVVWLGFDQPHALGRGASGGRLALPVFSRLVQQGLDMGWLEPNERFVQPPGTSQITIDAASGQLPHAVVRRETLSEAFIAGNEPRRRLDDEWVGVLAMPWYLQEPFYLPKEGEKMPAQTNDWKVIRSAWQRR